MFIYLMNLYTSINRQMSNNNMNLCNNTRGGFVRVVYYYFIIYVAISSALAEFLI